MTSINRSIAQAIGKSVAAGTISSTGSISGGGVTSVSTHSSLTYTGNSVGDLKFVDSADRLYIWGGTGWYSIAITNRTPSFTTSPSASYSLDSTNTNTINLVASDSDDQPLQWTFTTTDSAYQLASLVNDSNGTFRITGKTLAQILAAGYDSNGGSFDVTFKATDGINFAGASSTFSLSYQGVQAAFDTWAASKADFTITNANSSFTSGNRSVTTRYVLINSLVTAAGSMWGSSWGTNFTSDSNYTRIIQHALPDSSTYNALVTAGNAIMLRGVWTPTNTSSFSSVNRNGFQSTSYGQYPYGQLYDIWYVLNNRLYRGQPYSSTEAQEIQISELPA